MENGCLAFSSWNVIGKTLEANLLGSVKQAEAMQFSARQVGI
tara:strand:- start:1119 stop:1244 length:126 start_codon:yes stop_codon:yes gene_type:complete